MRKSAIAVAAFAILVGIAPQVRAAADHPAYRMTTNYRVFWLGLPVFKGTVTGRALDGRYALAFKSEATGLLRALRRSEINATAAGLIEPARYRALQFNLRAKWKEKRRSVDMNFAPDGGLRLSVSPLEPGKRKPVPPTIAAAGLDPLTALLHSTTVPLNTPACSLTVPIFDGRRRFDVRLERVGTAKLEHLISPLLDREAVKCRIHVRRIAGFTKKEIKNMDKARDRHAVIWVSKLRRLKMWLPVRFSYMSRWGPATGRVVGIDIAPLAQTD
ncbi:MAG TPA: DUF3108 domain-containing protein [Alphaproteobacteria bacterium]|nr:DUF3108 domain-containing protein [Alphaproteobacteria bacterium]